MVRGYSLVSLVVGLSLLGMVLVATLPRVSGVLDQWACTAAREVLIARAERARLEAGRYGSAQLVVDPDSSRIWIEVAGVPMDFVDLQVRYGVRLLQPAQTRPVRLRFDRLGIGRFANRTFEVGRGRAHATLTVSSYGRLRR